MWLFTTIGFYSIVQHHENEDVFLIRSRAVKDLENLIKKLPFLKKRKIHVDLEKDYYCRIFVSKLELQQIMERLTAMIDYTNFKSAVAKKKNQEDKINILSEIWWSMLTYQENILDKISELRRSARTQDYIRH